MGRTELFRWDAFGKKEEYISEVDDEADKVQQKSGCDGRRVGNVEHSTGKLRYDKHIRVKRDGA